MFPAEVCSEPSQSDFLQTSWPPKPKPHKLTANGSDGHYADDVAPNLWSISRTFSRLELSQALKST
jgi:hypothetical protein